MIKAYCLFTLVVPVWSQKNAERNQEKRGLNKNPVLKPPNLQECRASKWVFEKENGPENVLSLFDQCEETKKTKRNKLNQRGISIGGLFGLRRPIRRIKKVPA